MTGKMCRKARKADNRENNGENSKRGAAYPRESMLLKNLYYLLPFCYIAFFPKFGAALFGT